MIDLEVHIRDGRPEDIPAVLGLVKELALYERAPHEVENTEDQMLEDAFGKHPCFGFAVAEVSGEIVGMAAWYFRYSTWKGKRLYLEDIIVTESFRGKKIGKALFDAVIQKALELDCNGISWQVLDWNEPAINFYKKYNASFDPEWINGSLSRKQIEEYRRLR